MWVEALRITACFAVVLLHINVRWLYSVPIHTLEWHVLNFWNSVTRFAVPVFFMISGLLYLEPSKKISISDLYKKYIGKLFVSYWCWRVIYGAFDVIVYYEMRMEASALIKEILKTAILSPRMHMWYLPVFIGILAICPLLKLITDKRNMQLLAYCVLLFLVFGVLRSTVLLFQFPHKDLVAPILNAVSPEMLTGCIGFFLLGIL